MIADMVQTEMPAPPVDAGLNQLQHKVGAVEEAGRKVVLASVGLCAYIVDGVAAVYQEGIRFFSSAERRGLRMSRDITRRFGDLEAQAVGEMRRLQNQVDVDHMYGGFLEAKDSSEEDLEKRVRTRIDQYGAS